MLDAEFRKFAEEFAKSVCFTDPEKIAMGAWHETFEDLRYTYVEVDSARRRILQSPNIDLRLGRVMGYLHAIHRYVREARVFAQPSVDPEVAQIGYSFDGKRCPICFGECGGRVYGLRNHLCLAEPRPAPHGNWLEGWDVPQGARSPLKRGHVFQLAHATPAEAYSNA